MNEPQRPPGADRCLRRAAWRGITLVAFVGLAGCQSPSVPFDPFLGGRTTIPPPGTAVPAAAAPYYNAAPPTVSVPGASTIYAPPGVTPGPAPTSALPAAGSGRFPRGVTLPQSSTQTARDDAQLAGWQPADASDLRDSAATGADGSDKPADKTKDTRSVADERAGGQREDPKSSSGVVHASHEVPSREPPIRIIEPKLKSKR